MALSRRSLPKLHTHPNASLTNNQNQSHYSHDKSQNPSSPYFLHETLILMIQKIIQLTQLLIKSDLNSSNSQSYQKPTLINLVQRKKSQKDFSPPTPTLARQIDRGSRKFSDLRGEFEKMRERVMEYKENTSMNRIEGESPITKRSVEVGEFQISMIKMEEEYQKELKQITERIVTVEEDMGELLMLYKEIVFAH